VADAADARPTLADHLRGAASLAPRVRVVLEALAEAGVRLAREIARAPLAGNLGETGGVNAHGDRVRRLDLLANELLLAALRDTAAVTAVGSEELAEPVVWRASARDGLLVCLDPLDGSLNTDVAGVLGTIFGIRRGPPDGDAAQGLLGPGTDQVAAGYLVFGPATVLVYAADRGAHVFVLDPADGRFRLTHAGVRTPAVGRTYAVNDANWPRWGPGPRAVVERLRTPDRALRYAGAMVADFHRTLLEGGIYLYPEDAERPTGRIRLLYEAAPLALVAEAAGGRASTGRARVLDVAAADYHQRTPLYIGSPEEVGLAERCLRDARG
jgi:fructose-1,6-bisphosphatase I